MEQNIMETDNEEIFLLDTTNSLDDEQRTNQPEQSPPVRLPIIHPDNLQPNYNTNTKLVDMSSEYDLDNIPGLGKPLTKINRTAEGPLVQVYLKYLNEAKLAHETNDPELIRKSFIKVVLIPVCTLTHHQHHLGPTDASIAVSTLARIQRLLENDWNHQVSDFPGVIQQQPDQKPGSRGPGKGREVYENENDTKRLRKLYKLISVKEVGKAYKQLLNQTASVSIDQSIIDCATSLFPPKTSPLRFPADIPSIQLPERAAAIPCEDDDDDGFGAIGTYDTNAVWALANRQGVDYTIAAVSKVIERLPNGVAPGKDLLTADILKVLWKCNRVPNADLQSFHSLVTWWISTIDLSQKCPTFIRSFYRGASLVLLGKPGHVPIVRPKIRPIQPASIFTKVADNVTFKPIIPNIGKKYGKVQKGVGISFGSDQNIHSGRLQTELHVENSILDTDFVNGFNNLHQQPVITQVNKIAPQLNDRMKLQFTETPTAVLRGAKGGITTFMNAEGIPQGGVSSAALYAIGTAPIFCNTDTIAKNNCEDGGSASAYIDDCNVSSSDQGIVSCIDHFDRFQNEGVTLNMSKVKVLLSPKPSADQMSFWGTQYLNRGLQPENILVHPLNGGDPSQYGHITLGVPVGADEYMRKQVAVILQDLSDAFVELHWLCKHNPQLTYLFLRSCVPASLLHYLRGIPPEFSLTIAEAFDQHQRTLLADILQIPLHALSEITYFTATLPFAAGGGGLTCLRRIVDPAYVASYIAAIPHMKSVSKRFTLMLEGRIPPTPAHQSFLQAVERIHQLDPNTTLTSLLNLGPKDLHQLQKRLTEPFKSAAEKWLTTTLETESFERHRAAILSGSTPEASAWLRAIPSVKELQLPSKEFAQSLRYRLLAQTYTTTDGPLTCNCRGRPSIVDTFGDHDHKCGFDNILRFNTHNQLSRDIANLAHYATQGYAQIEPTDCFRLGSPTSGDRLDVIVEPGTAQCVGIDVIVTHPVSANLTPREAAVPGRMAEKKAHIKKVHYSNLCALNNITFVAAAIETGGRFCRDFRNYLEKLFSLISNRNQIPIATIREFWYQRLAIRLQRANSHATLYRQRRRRTALATTPTGHHLIVPEESHSEISSDIYESTYANFGGNGAFNFIDPGS
jgi:hypothetical protein